MLMAAGIDRIMTAIFMRIKSKDFEVPVDHLYASTLFLQEIEKKMELKPCNCSTCVGGAKEPIHTVN